MSTLSRRTLVASAAALSAAGAGVLAAPRGQATPPRFPWRPAPSFQEVSVHDPSVVVADGRFYVFGSHLAAARSRDLQRWTSVADLVTPENPLFEDVTEELSEAFEWARTTTLWAPDVHATEDGRYRMYYCACEGSSPRSAMGTAIADDVEGPYRDEGIFLRSGMWDEPGEDGEIYDATVHPNVIDPQAFVDAEGALRLVYGSYSGGIFLLELDPATGRPLPDQGYGVHLTGGGHARIEAPYILHSEESGYYYLLLTFGGLDADGGYNVRVGRSHDVEGPYLDPMGQDLREAQADPDQPMFDDASIEPYAAKLMGNHRFMQSDGRAGQAYVSPGHVSAWTHPSTRESFLLFHTRFPGDEELHEVRVHRLHLTRTGWLVVAPHRYGGDALAGRPGPLQRSELVGDWQLIDHGRAISADIVDSVALRLEDDGTLGGGAEGRWHLEGTERAVLEIDGARREGVFTLGWHEELGEWTPTFSVLGEDGRALWGTKEV